MMTLIAFNMQRNLMLSLLLMTSLEITFSNKTKILIKTKRENGLRITLSVIPSIQTSFYLILILKYLTGIPMKITSISHLIKCEILIISRKLENNDQFIQQLISIIHSINMNYEYYIKIHEKLIIESKWIII